MTLSFFSLLTVWGGYAGRFFYVCMIGFRGRAAQAPPRRMNRDAAGAVVSHSSHIKTAHVL